MSECQSTVRTKMKYFFVFLVLLSVINAGIHFIGFNFIDFNYPTFEITHGLDFVRNATTSSCNSNAKYYYREEHGKNDYNNLTDLPEITTNSPDSVAEEIIMNNPENETTSTNPHIEASFYNKDEYKRPATDGCAARLRLTSSEPHSIGAVWRQNQFPVLRNWKCGFTFQITDLSQHCEVHRDASFLQRHKSCAVYGGDGFAFVIQSDLETKNSSIGSSGRGIGYEGIMNSLAIEFDTFYNPDVGDILPDHISVQSKGKEKNSADKDGRIAGPKPYPNLSNGNIHNATIQYYPYINMDFVEYFTATNELLKFIKDNDEGMRVGTMVIYIDEDEKNEDNEPFLAFPINLSKTLDLSDGYAYVGFTSSTGRRYEKHDILSWYCCATKDCDINNSKEEYYDYHDEDVINEDIIETQADETKTTISPP